MSASASPGLKIEGVSHAIETRGSWTRAGTTWRRSAVIGGVSALIGRHRGTPLQRAEVLLDQLLGRRDVDVADDRHARVVRRVELAEEPPHVVQLHRLDVLVRSDDVAVVRVALREQRLHQRFFGKSVRLVLDALAPLVADDVLLVRERGLVDLLEQIAHAIGFEPQRQLELVRRHGLEVVRAVVVRGAVHAASRRPLRAAESANRAARASSSGTSCARTGARSRCGPAPRWPARRGTRGSPPPSAAGDPGSGSPPGRSAACISRTASRGISAALVAWFCARRVVRQQPPARRTRRGETEKRVCMAIYS